MSNTNLKTRDLKVIAQWYLYYRENKINPAYRDLVELTNISSTSIAKYHVSKLIDLGYMKASKKNTSRGVSLTPAGNALAVLYLGLKQITCPHCGAPVDNGGKYKAQTRQKIIKQNEKPALAATV